MKLFYMHARMLIGFLLCYIVSLSALVTNEVFEIDAVAVQADGNIVIAGTAHEDESELILVARFTSAGVLDTSFSGDGKVLTAIGRNARAEAVTIQADGNIVVAGNSKITGTIQVALARYTPTGNLDTSFGTNGIVATNLLNGSTANAVLMQSTKIVIAGTVVDDGVSKLLLARYNSDGTLDTTFGNAGTGIVITSYGTAANGRALTQDASGNLIIAGAGVANSMRSFLAARYSSEGIIDTSFGVDGIIATPIDSFAQAESLVAQSDSKIVLGGLSVSGPSTQLALARYNTDGSLDTSFGDNGIVRTLPERFAIAKALLLQSDDKIIAAGRGDVNYLLARYTNTGALDTSYGPDANGLVTIIVENNDTIKSAALDASGNAIVAGHTAQNAAVARVTTGGNQDLTFGDRGLAKLYSATSFFNEAQILDEKTIGTAGGSFTGGTWQTRNLNTLYGNNGFVTLTGNVFTLRPGVYDIECIAPAYRVQGHQIRLLNVTDLNVSQLGSSEFSVTGPNASTTSSQLKTTLIVPKLTTFAVQHRGNGTRAGDGMGQPVGFSANEVYTRVYITKIQNPINLARRASQP